MPRGRTTSDEKRDLIIKLKKRGNTAKQIKGQLRISLRTVYKYWGN